MLGLVSAMLFGALKILLTLDGKVSISSIPFILGCNDTRTVITDLTINFCSPTDRSSTCALDPLQWSRVEKELYLHTTQQSAWLHVKQKKVGELSSSDLVVTDIRVGDRLPDFESDRSWEIRPGGIWLLRSGYSGDSHKAATSVDVLFGMDAVDPRPQWTLIGAPLRLKAPSETPVAKLSVRYGMAESDSDSPKVTLPANKDGKFKIVQISDTHMVTGVGVCKDPLDAHGRPLPESEADPLTVDFLRDILELEKPDLVILTGDQLHHDIPDSQSAIFKVLASLIERSIPYAAVFGNHDAEGNYALSRK